MDETIKNRVEKQIIDSAKFTQDWMNGRDGLNYSDFEEKMAGDFTIVMVNGQLLDKNALESMMNSIKGKWRVKISVEDINLRKVAGVIIAIYTEIHKSENVDTRTLATSIFTSADLKWVSFHATTIKPN